MMVLFYVASNFIGVSVTKWVIEYEEFNLIVMFINNWKVNDFIKMKLFFFISQFVINP